MTYEYDDGTDDCLGCVAASKGLKDLEEKLVNAEEDRDALELQRKMLRIERDQASTERDAAMGNVDLNHSLIRENYELKRKVADVEKDRDSWKACFEGEKEAHQASVDEFNQARERLANVEKRAEIADAYEWLNGIEASAKILATYRRSQKD